MCDAAKPRILLIIAGGIAAYKSLELIRRLREREFGVRCILTRAGAEFVTPLAVASLSGEKVFTDLFSLTDEAEMGHIRLSREADLVVVAPATADLIAKMAHGLADDLASTALLATDKPVLIAPAMNPAMWEHPATRRNIAQVAGRRGAPGRAESRRHGLRRDRARAHGRARPDRRRRSSRSWRPPPDRSAGMRALVTSGPTVEAIDPVRFIANRSSGKQGHAIAAALAGAGAEVDSGERPGARAGSGGRERRAGGIGARNARGLPGGAAGRRRGVRRRGGRLARGREQPRQAQEAAGGVPPTLVLAENPDILKTLSRRGPRGRAW